MNVFYISKEHLHEEIKSEFIEYFLFRRSAPYKRPWAFTDEIQEFLLDKGYDFFVDPMLESDIRSTGIKVSDVSYILTLDQIISIQKPRIEFDNPDDLLIFKLMFK